MRAQQFAMAVVAVAGLFVSACGTDGGSRDQPSAGSLAAAVPSGVAPSVPQFGGGCAAVPADPANSGSFEAMANKPVAAAISGNAGLSSLADALRRAGLVDSWNAATALTVFAPTNRAFAAMPKALRRNLLADKKSLTRVLSYLVVAKRLSPPEVVGTHRTSQGGSVTVVAQGDALTVDGTSAVVCGNVATRNATVYIVDGVLMPKR